MEFKKHQMCVHCSPAKHFSSVDALGTHILRFHGFLQFYMCGGCKKVLMHKNSLIRHIMSEHVNKPRQENPPLDMTNELAGSSAQGSQMVDDDAVSNADQDISEPSVQYVPQPEVLNVKAAAARFLLDLRSSGNITGSSVSLIQDFVFKLMKTVVSDLKEKTTRFLEEFNGSSEESEKFISETFDFENPFKDLQSTEEQMNYYSSNFGLVKPEEKFLDSRIENRWDREAKVFLPKQVPETFQSVSLVETLKLVVRNSYLRGLILSESPSNDGIKRNYKDGYDFKKDPFLQKYHHAVRLILYQDDLETANALGSKDVIHKLGCFYFSIQNFPPLESSHLSSVFLVALTYAEDLKKDGAFRKVLVPFLEDLKMLKTDKGVEVDLPEGGSFTLRACLVCLCADSLAAHVMLGFLSPSATMFCRLCMISKEEFKANSAAIGTIRTSRMHETQVKKVEKNPTKALFKQFGIKERTVLSTAMKVPEGSVLDAFHDLVGIIHMLIKLACHEFICVKKLLTTSDFNNNLNMFVYGTPDVKNKPSPNISYKNLCSAGHSLKQSASQTFCLLRVFPFLIDGIEEDNKHLELIFLMQDIVKVIFSFELRDADIDRLESLIHKHNSLFHEVFVSPSQPVVAEGSDSDQLSDDDQGSDSDEEINVESEEEETPVASSSGPNRRRRGQITKKLKKGINKLHHLVHYPKQIREKGPIIRLWTALFERRHRLIRKHSAVLSNFRNVPKSMARMFQLGTMALYLDQTGPEEDKFSVFGADFCLVSNSPYFDQLLAAGFQESDEIRTVKSAQVSGVEYRVGLFVSLKSDDALSFEPIFAVILDVLVKVSPQPKVYLAVQKCESKGLSARYNSYEVTLSTDEPTILLTVEELAHFRAIAPWSPVKSVGTVKLFLHPRTVFL